MKFLVNGILKFIFLGVLFCFFLNNYAFCQEEKTTVRVGISNQSFSMYEHSSAKFSSPDDILLVDMASNKQYNIPKNRVISVEIKNSKFKVTLDDGVDFQNLYGPLVLTPKEKIAIVDLNRKGSPAYYGGLIELKSTRADKFNIINVLDSELYLGGVVPNEMPVSFGFEALKAQAVAARNYVNRPQNPYKNYDVCDSTACQVYYGLNSNREISDKAVNQTKGIFALYDGEPILALYCSTSGGITEDWKNVYGLNSKEQKPYLVSVSDDKNQPLLKSEEDVREYYSKKQLSYDIKSPRYRWSVEWGKDELEKVLNKTLLEQSKSGLVQPKFDGSYTLKDLKEINVLKRGNSGKALEIEIVFKNGTFRVQKELIIRRVLKKNNQMLYSGNFFVDKVVQKKDEKTDNDEEKSIFSFEKMVDETCEEKFVITGGGFGHGVGMSQYGAGYMAQSGYNFAQILKHYYSKITLGTMKKEVFYNPYLIEYKTEFYWDKKAFNKAILKVDNHKRVSKVKFRVNSQTFETDMNSYSAKNLGMDITKYLKEGLNTVVFEPLEEKDANKSITYQIEVLEGE